jgi:hypothetical protein
VRTEDLPRDMQAIGTKRIIEKGRAASNSTHYKFGCFLSFSQHQKYHQKFRYCNILIMNIEINIFTVLKKDLKNVSERSNLKI